MNIDLTIGWNDLNDQCRAKIKALHKSLKPESSSVKIKYPSVSDLFVYCNDDNNRIRVSSDVSTRGDSYNGFSYLSADDSARITTRATDHTEMASNH